MAIPYVAPFAAMDPPPHDLIVLFLEAVARVTPAFTELRASVLPKYSPPSAPVDEIKTWMRTWNLDFPTSGCELREQVENWVFRVLDWWRCEPEMGNAGWLERSKRPDVRRSVSSAVAVSVPPWSPAEEGFEAYATRMRAGFEKVLQEERRTRETELETYDMRPYLKRETKRPPVWDFEWLALSVCLGWSAGEIAKRPNYGVPRARVIKALRKLREALHIETEELRD